MTARSKSKGPGLTSVFADHPLREGTPSFDFAGFARTLAELALNPGNRTPFTVVVRGEWGRGKTTLLETTRRVLDADGKQARAAEMGYRRVETLWLNAWKYPQEDSILAGLLGALLDRLRGGDFSEQAKSLIESHKGSLVPYVLRRASPALFGMDMGEGPRDRFDEVRNKRAFYDHFRELFGQLSWSWFHGGAWRDNFGKALDGKQAAVAVFLDDLDRCREERVVETLEAINLFLDQPGVCFYLGLDWQRVREVIERASGGRQEQFLEKIVQVALDLPEVAEEGAEGYIGDLIRDTSLADVLGPHVVTVAGVLRRRDPRHVKRFLNDLSVRLGVLHHTGKLGAGGERVPREAVVSWHLLAESLPEATWWRLTRHRANVEAFLVRYQSMRVAGGEKDALPEKPAAMEDEEYRLFTGGKLGEHLERIRGLTRAQRDLLVHLGSPSREEASPRATVRTAAGFGPDWWVSIPAGSFTMGSDDGPSDERPAHPVDLSAFEISRYPVTNAQYAEYVKEAGAVPPWREGPTPEGREDHPVVGIRWSDATAFCAWLSKKLAADDKRVGPFPEVGLPTEAQWEYAARGAEGRIYPWGNDEPIRDHANFGMIVGDTTPVGTYARGKTPEGVHDLAGNVWEWCRDWYGGYPDHRVGDPTGPEKGSGRVLRGGSFLLDPILLRGDYRSSIHPGSQSVDRGFRCVRRAAGGQGG